MTFLPLRLCLSVGGETLFISLELIWQPKHSHNTTCHSKALLLVYQIIIIGQMALMCPNIKKYIISSRPVHIHIPLSVYIERLCSTSLLGIHLHFVAGLHS